MGASEFLGTNSSLNLRTSLIEEALIVQGFYDKGLNNGYYEFYELENKDINTFFIKNETKID